MPRADTYGAYYRDARARLLHQVYAYSGNTEVAQRSVADAFVSAGHHWRKLADNPDKDAWMREQAFRASGRAQNRSRRPWYVNAMSTDDAHRPLLGVLSELDPVDRKLLILTYLVGLDLPTAARESGLPDTTARISLETSLGKLAATDVDTEPAQLTQLLDHLMVDLHEEALDRASRLKREGNRRRRSHMVLAGVTSLALAIGAGAVTAAQTPAEPIDEGSNSGFETAQPPPPEVEMFTVDSLATVDDVLVLGPARPWSIVLTSSDFGDDDPIHDCLVGTPSEKRAAHYWVRTFGAGTDQASAEAIQSLEIAQSPETAESTYDTLVKTLSTCRDGDRKINGYSEIGGVGDSASMFTMQYVSEGQIRDEQVIVARSGIAITTWVVRPTVALPIRSRLVVKLAGRSADAICTPAEGACPITPFDVTAGTPPADERTAGFLSAVDLPLFAAIPEPWVATKPKPVVANPASTDCDQADFTGEAADAVRSRTFVVPDAPELGPVFGMTQTMGTFADDTAARAFVRQVTRSVGNCENRQLSLSVERSDEIHAGPINGRVWQINLAASEDTTLVFRVCLIRVGATVTQVTFTPTDAFDVDHEEFIELADRAGARLQQL